MSSRWICWHLAGPNLPACFHFAQTLFTQIPRGKLRAETHLSVTLRLTVLDFTPLLAFQQKPMTVSLSKDWDSQQKNQSTLQTVMLLSVWRTFILQSGEFVKG